MNTPTSHTLRQWRNAHLQASRVAPERVAEQRTEFPTQLIVRASTA